MGSNFRPREPHVKAGSYRATKAQLGNCKNLALLKLHVKFGNQEREREVEEVEREHILKFYTWSTKMNVYGDKNPLNKFKQKCDNVK